MIQSPLYAAAEKVVREIVNVEDVDGTNACSASVPVVGTANATKEHDVMPARIHVPQWIIENVAVPIQALWIAWVRYDRIRLQDRARPNTARFGSAP